MTKLSLKIGLLVGFASMSTYTLALDTVTTGTTATVISESAANTAIQAGLDKGLTLEAAMTAAINENPTLAQNILAAAIAMVGADSPQVASVLSAARDAGVNSDVVTSIALANNVDAGVASQATAAGPAATPVVVAQAPAAVVIPTPPPTAPSKPVCGISEEC